MSITKMKSASAELSNGLGKNARKEVAECLSHCLADTYLLYLKTQFYHWNVTGPQFHGLHIMFETQYNELAAATDELAERIRALGFTAPGTFHEFSELASLKEDKAVPEDAQAMLRNLVASHEAVSKELRAWIKSAQEAGDEGTADILIRRTQEHDKSAWMLRSYLQ